MQKNMCGSFPKERSMIGIDGGGTKTEFVLFTESGRILQRIKLSKSNPNDIGLDKSCELLMEGIDKMLQISPEVCCIFAGIAGGMTGRNAEYISHVLNSKYESIRISVNTDGVNALSCTGNVKDGMALICGTGSVLFARKDNALYRLGGWGYLFDESGSAYDIGKDAVRAVLSELDGMGEETILTERLRDELKGGIWESLDALYQKGKAYIASLAPAVFYAAEEGDAVAERILQKNAAHLAQLILTAGNRYQCGNTIVACGGMFEHFKEVLLPMIGKELPYEVHFAFPLLPPVYGACV